MDVEEIVALSVKHNVSDLHLCSDSPPRWRRSGRLEPAPFPPPDVEALLKAWLNDEQQGAWWANGQVDFAVTLAGRQRLRGSAFKHMLGVSIALRLLPLTCPQLSALGVPRAIPELLSNDNGLILVTGATGSGKSTTLAAMVDFLNHQTDGHILTLEDPVEFMYQSERCLIQQREIGQHSPSFAEALRSALREDPDVILLGELRDSETIRLALTAAETGHLVLATLHTRGAAGRSSAWSTPWGGGLEGIMGRLKLNPRAFVQRPEATVLEQASACPDGAQTFIAANGDAKAAMDFGSRICARRARLLGAVHVQRRPIITSPGCHS